MEFSNLDAGNNFIETLEITMSRIVFFPGNIIPDSQGHLR
jgi:hypothetical protein